MYGVLLVAHGSRKNERNKIFDEILDMVRLELSSDFYVDGIIISMREMDIEDRILKMIQNGCKTIKIVPYFLFSGSNVVKSISEKIKGINEKYEDIEIMICTTLGVNKKMVDIIVEKVLNEEGESENGL